jgi:hypothetical protein
MAAATATNEGDNADPRSRRASSDRGRRPVHQVLLAQVIFLRPEVNPTLRPIIDYAIGRFGRIMVLAFSVQR